MMVLVVGGLGFVLVRDYSTSSPTTTTITTDITHGQGCVLWFVQRHVMMMYEQTLDFIPTHKVVTARKCTIFDDISIVACLLE